MNDYPTGTPVPPLRTRVAQQILEKADTIHRIDQYDRLEEDEKRVLREIVAQGEYQVQDGLRLLKLDFDYWVFSSDCVLGTDTIAACGCYLSALRQQGFLNFVKVWGRGAVYTVNLAKLQSLPPVPTQRGVG